MAFQNFKFLELESRSETLTTRKLDPMNIKSFIPGYYSNNYRVWYIEKGQLLICRDVIRLLYDKLSDPNKKDTK